MPRYSANPGDHVGITLKGYVVYNAGGFIGITNSKKVLKSPRAFDRDKGEFYFDIPEHMIVAEPTKAHEYPEGTLARVSGITSVGCATDPPQRTGPLVLEYRHEAKRAGQYGETHWFFANTNTPVSVGPEAKVEILWNPEES